MLVSAIANTLQRIGVNINIDCSELVNRQALVQLSLDNKKLLLEILKRCSFCSFERTSLAAQKLLKYFEEL